GGKAQEIEAGELSFAEQLPTRVVAVSNWKAGELRATTRSQWDYDGLMKWTLELQPSPRPVESMTLVIPLDDKKMPLMHTCVHGLRSNYAGATPAGQGPV